jgi:hypothetical protein
MAKKGLPAVFSWTSRPRGAAWLGPQPTDSATRRQRSSRDSGPSAMSSTIAPAFRTDSTVSFSGWAGPTSLSR